MIDKISKLLQNSTVIKIISFLIAFIAFLMISQTGSPWWRDLFQQTQIVNNVVVTTNYDSNKYYVSGLPDKMPISISGSENEIINAKNQEQTMHVYIDLSNYEPGKYTLSASDMRFDVPAGVKASSVVPEYSVDIQNKAVEDMPIQVSYANNNVDNGFVFSTPKLSQNYVKVKGGSETISSISNIEAIVDLSQVNVTGSSGTSSIKANLVAYNASGVPVEDIELSTTSVDVTFDYNVETKEVPVSFEYSGNNDRYVASICPTDQTSECNINTQTIVKIYGDSNKIKSITEKGKLTYAIDLSQVDGNSGVVQGVAILPDGVFVLGGDTKEFKVTLDTGVSKTFDNVNIQTEGLNPKFSIKAVSADDGTVNVKVTGANAVVNGYTDSNGNQVEGLNANDIQVYIDLSNITAPGVYELPIIVNQNKPFTYELNHSSIKVEVVENPQS